MVPPPKNHFPVEREFKLHSLNIKEEHDLYEPPYKKGLKNTT